MRSSDGRVATRALRAPTEHPIGIIITTIAIEEPALRAAAAQMEGISGSAPAPGLHLQHILMTQWTSRKAPPPAMTVSRASTQQLWDLRLLHRAFFVRLASILCPGTLRAYRARHLQEDTALRDQSQHLNLCVPLAISVLEELLTSSLALRVRIQGAQGQQGSLPAHPALCRPADTVDLHPLHLLDQYAHWVISAMEEMLTSKPAMPASI